MLPGSTPSRSLPRSDSLLLVAALLLAGCAGPPRIRYVIQPAPDGDSLRVTMTLEYTRPPARLALTGRASVDVMALRRPRAWDERGRPVALESRELLHTSGKRATRLPSVEVRSPIPRRLTVEYWLDPEARDGNSHMGFARQRAFGIRGRELTFFASRNVLLLPDQAMADAGVEIDVVPLPGGTAAAPWNGKGEHFVPGVAGRYVDQDLVSGTVAIGRLTSERFRVGRTAYEVVFPAGALESERRRALERMKTIAYSVHETFGFELGPTYTVLAMPGTASGDEVNVAGWGTGQGGTLLPLTPGRALRFARRLTEAYVRHQPHRRPLTEPDEYWVVDALEQLVPWWALARAGIADAAQVRAYYAAEYQATLDMLNVDPDLLTFYADSRPRTIERETIAPLLLTFWLHPGSAADPTTRAIDWKRVFRGGHVSDGLGSSAVADEWRELLRRHATGAEPVPVESMLDRLVLEPLPSAPARSTTPLELVFTSNTEGYLETCGCKTSQAGGMARRATVLESIRRQGAPVLLVDGGGAFARPEKRGELDLLGREEERLFLKLMADLSYDAVAIGETELVSGIDRFADASKAAKLPWVSANVTRGGRPLAPGWKRIRVGGATVGVIGVFVPPTGPDADDAFYRSTGDMRFADPGSAVADAVREMGPVDLLVVTGRLPPATIQDVVSSCPDVDVVLSSESPTSIGRRKGAGETNAVAGVLHGAVVVMSQLSKYGVGHLRLELDPAQRVAGARLTSIMLEPNVEDAPEVRAALTQFYARVARAGGAEHAMETLFPGDHERQTGRYAGAAACAACHAGPHEQWLTTPHSTAYQTLLNVHRHYNPRCVPCHVVGFGTDQGYRLGDATEALVNVQCEVCHGPGAAHAEAPRKDNIRRAVPESVCLSCHTPEHSDTFIYAERLPKVLHTSQVGGFAAMGSRP